MSNKIQGIVLAALVAVLLAALTFVFLDRRTPSGIVIQPGTVADIVVEVSGGVATPGVYELPASSRLQQAIDRAGGLTAEGDVSSLNLAGRLADGEKVVIPVRTAGDDPGRPLVEGGTPRPDSLGDSDSLIDLNTASAADLDSLPGIGPVIAERILEYRDNNGPFTSVDELVEIEGISAAMVDELRPLVTVGV